MSSSYTSRFECDAIDGYTITAEFYDAAVSGADPVAERPGFKAMLDRIAGNGVRSSWWKAPTASRAT
jgi:hypothetical protein